MSRIPRNRQNWTNRRRRQDVQNRNQHPVAFHSLPFAHSFFQFVLRNRDKDISLIIGIGTSGSRNVKEVAIFANRESHRNRNKAFFLLMIDTEYTDSDKRIVSLEPLEELGYRLTGNAEAIHEVTGNAIYLWGATLPTAYDSLEKYQELRDNLHSAYEYGRQCNLTPETREFYNALSSFFHVPILKRIYVYNQGFFNTRRVDVILSRDTLYRGPEFREQRRIVQQTQDEMIRRGRGDIVPMLTVGQYFENFCELLYCLSRAEKPVFLINEDKETGDLISVPLYRDSISIGGKRLYKTRRSRRATR